MLKSPAIKDSFLKIPFESHMHSSKSLLLSWNPSVVLLIVSVRHETFVTLMRNFVSFAHCQYESCKKKRGYAKKLKPNKRRLLFANAHCDSAS